MKVNYIIYALPLALALGESAVADISLGAPTPGAESRGVYHTELLAANAVHAVLKEIHTLPAVSLDGPPSMESVAVFEVKQNLAHRRYDRMGDPTLQPGSRFTVSLASDVPGQDAALGNIIREMKPGDEALLNMDHIYVFRESGNESVRACTRFAKVQPRQPEPTQLNGQPAPVQQPLPVEDVVPQQVDRTPPPLAPIPGNVMNISPNDFLPSAQMTGSSHSVVTRITIEQDGQGGTRRMKEEIHREVAPDGTVTERKFINDVEVDPQTDKPLAIPSAPPVTPQAPPAPQPDVPQPQEPAPTPPQGEQQILPELPPEF